MSAAWLMGPFATAWELTKWSTDNHHGDRRQREMIDSDLSVGNWIANLSATCTMLIALDLTTRWKEFDHQIQDAFEPFEERSMVWQSIFKWHSIALGRSQASGIEFLDSASQFSQLQTVFIDNSLAFGCDLWAFA